MLDRDAQFGYDEGMSAPAELAPEELLAALSELQGARHSPDAQLLSVVAEIDARGLATERGSKDTSDLLRTVQRVSLREANARAEAARVAVPQRSLIGEPLPAALPETAVALACAEISLEHVTVIRQTMAKLPPHLHAQHHEQLERDLAEHARVLDPEALRKAGTLALSLLDPDGPRPRDGAPTKNRLRFRPHGTGVEANGWFDQESAAILRTALSPLASPRPEHAPGDCDDSRCDDSRCDHGLGDTRPDPRSIAEREGDALVELARRALDSGNLPVDGGNRPHLTVTISLDNLRGNTGGGLLEFGDGVGRGVLCAEEVRRLACDAEIVPIVLGTNGEPLDVGRTARVVNRAMRRALDQRDGGCSFPGCTAPAAWTRAHHIEQWANGGATSLHNSCLLCPRHHRLIHKGEWTIVMENGTPVFHPPRWAGGPPARNILHRPDMIARPVDSAHERKPAWHICAKSVPDPSRHGRRAHRDAESTAAPWSSPAPSPWPLCSSRRRGQGCRRHRAATAKPPLTQSPGRGR
jgi:hypothetical protein